MDKAIGVGRAFTTGALKGNSDNKAGKTLVLVTADHDQSIHILGLVDTTVLAPRRISGTGSVLRDW